MDIELSKSFYFLACFLQKVNMEDYTIIGTSEILAPLTITL